MICFHNAFINDKENKEGLNLKFSKFLFLSIRKKQAIKVDLTATELVSDGDKNQSLYLSEKHYTQIKSDFCPCIVQN